MNQAKRLAGAIAIMSALSGVMLVGCSAKPEVTATGEAPSDGASTLAGSLKNIIADSDSKAELAALKAQLKMQQQRLEAMSEEQQFLQEALKRQRITVEVHPLADANAGRSNSATASTAYIAFLENKEQLADIEALASKEFSVIPNRQNNVTLSIPQGMDFIAIKLNLRYTKKRSQFVIPLSSLDFDTPLTLNIGACDVNITSGVNPELAPDFTQKLNYYQQPLVSCL